MLVVLILTMEEHVEYDYVGTNQNLRVQYDQRGYKNPVYMVPNPEMLDKENEYEALQTNTLESTNQPSSKQRTTRSTNSARVTTSKDDIVWHSGKKTRVHCNLHTYDCNSRDHACL